MLILKFYPNKDRQTPYETFSRTELSAAYYAARKHLFQTVEGRMIFKKVESSEKTVTLHIDGSQNGRNTFEFKSGTNQYDAFWNPNKRLRLRNGNQSPALGLAHELGHAVQCIYKNKWYSQHNTGDQYLKIEEDNLSSHETPIAVKLGEPSRTNYRDCIGDMPFTGRLFRTMKLDQRVTHHG